MLLTYVIITNSVESEIFFFLSICCNSNILQDKISRHTHPLFCLSTGFTYPRQTFAWFFSLVSSTDRFRNMTTQQVSPAAVVPVPPASVVRNAFVHQYYHVLHQSPQMVFRFYQDSSKLGRPEPNGEMSCTTTMAAINDKIISLDYSDYTAEIRTVDSQDSYNQGVLVLVTGALNGKDGLKRNFT